MEQGELEIKEHLADIKGHGKQMKAVFQKRCIHLEKGVL